VRVTLFHVNKLSTAPPALAWDTGVVSSFIHASNLACSVVHSQTLAPTSPPIVACSVWLERPAVAPLRYAWFPRPIRLAASRLIKSDCFLGLVEWDVFGRCQNTNAQTHVEIVTTRGFMRTRATVRTTRCHLHMRIVAVVPPQLWVAPPLHCLCGGRRAGGRGRWYEAAATGQQLSLV
jgi:hypothetical protein